ncbi:helix-turn-helix domain-containing protein [Streptomyces anandii]|uniref:helix-turn-helix domain-containing protein n=1 Tax=Streptomyces anandii TaxID=285454 RepID=UPI0036F7AE22
MFERGVRPPEVARRLRVSRKSAYAWHATWREGGLGLQGAWGLPVSAQRCTGGTAAGRAGGGAGGAWLDGGPAVDPCEGRGADPWPVRLPVHPAWGVVSAAPAGLVAASPRSQGRRAR